MEPGHAQQYNDDNNGQVNNDGSRWKQMRPSTPPCRCMIQRQVAYLVSPETVLTMDNTLLLPTVTINSYHFVNIWAPLHRSTVEPETTQ